MIKKAAVLALSVIAMASQAATISFSDTIAQATTNWTDALTLSKFDSALGTLNSVTFTYGGSVVSTFRGESLDAAPATVTLNAGASIIFGTPISQTLAINGSASRSLSAFDGAIDFGGTSGFSGVPVSGSDSGSLSLTSGLAAFIGAGTYDISVAANGASNATGAGNLITQIATVAGADIRVVYDYTAPPPPVVPEPGSMALVGLALAGLGLTARRRTAK